MEPPDQPRPHIGILADYGFTLVPHAGIGVFVYNLIDGLLTLNPRPKITFLAHPGDDKDLKEWAKRWQDRVRILPSVEENNSPKAHLARLLIHGYEKSLKIESVPSIRWDRFARRVKQQGIARILKGWKAVRSPSAPWTFAFAFSLTKLVFWLVVVALGSWLGEILSSFVLIFLIPSLAFPFRWAYRIYEKLVGTFTPLETRMVAAGCDVWLVPFAGTGTPIVAPHVLVIFDLVHRHVPEIYSAPVRDYVERLFAARAREATLIYCGSNFVKDHDLAPSFPSVADRIRVFQLAPPLDLQSYQTMPDLSTLCRKYRIGSRFLFYPAGQRAHKNHAMLVRAMKKLSQKAAHSSLELVFTGECRQSPELVRLIHQEGLSHRVHFLGVLSRREIQTLYRHALLVPLPSLHEGYGLPLLEALQNECPVACADIPAFRELVAGFNHGVQFFDPRDPDAMANAIDLTIARRDGHKERQREVYRRIAQRDWHAVAQDFLRIFEEAYHLARKSHPPSGVPFAPSQETNRHVA